MKLSFATIKVDNTGRFARLQAIFADLNEISRQKQSSGRIENICVKYLSSLKSELSIKTALKDLPSWGSAFPELHHLPGLKKRFLNTTLLCIMPL